jgi:hypothetical protein
MDELHALPSQYHWALADSALLQAITRKEPVALGARGRLLSRLVKVSCRFGMVWALIVLAGISELIRLQRQQRAATKAGDGGVGGYPARFFVGFGAGSEESLFIQYCKKSDIQTERLDQVNVSTFAALHHVSFLSGFRFLVRALVVAKKAINALPFCLSYWRTDFLTCVAMKAGYYAYMRAWFEMLKEEAGLSLAEVAFLAADTAAFAAVDAGLPVCYLQHGMIRHSLLLPAFSRVDALTTYEANHIRRRLPLAKVTVHSQSRRKLEPSLMAREILVASIYGDIEYMSRIASFVLWANAFNVPLQVRPHPRERSTFWQNYAMVGQVTIEEGDADIFQAIDRLRPRLMVSWFSTALLDALECGIIPVTVCSDDDSYVSDMVYPLFRRCLRWPQDIEIIEQILNDDEYYVSILSRLTEGCGGVSE